MFGCSPCHQGNGRATTSIEKAHGNYEHWLWPLFPKQNVEAGCQTCHAADMVLVSGDVGWTISEGKDLFRQRGCMGCHRYEGYDKEPEDLNSFSQQMKQLEQQKMENLKQAAYLMKQADAAESNDEANRLNDQAIALKVANSKDRWPNPATRFSDAQPNAGREEDRAEPEGHPAQAEQELDSGLVEEADRLPSHHQDAELPPDRSSDPGNFGLPVAVGIDRSAAQTKTWQRGARQRTLRNSRLPGLPLHRRRRPDAGRHLRRQPDARGRKGQLRLPGPLGSQRAPAHASILPVRKERYRSRGLRQEGLALRLRPAAQPVPQRRSRTASAEHDGDAQPAPGSRGRAGHRILS